MSLLPTTAPALPLADGEALEVLSAELDGHTDRIPARLVAVHLLRVTAGGDFAIRKAALDALLRRVKAVSDDWRIAGRRRGSRVTAGTHRVIVARGKRYQVLVASFRELRGSCDCADFARSSLGLCKHLWWLLGQGFDKKGKANADVVRPKGDRRRQAQAQRAARRRDARGPRVSAPPGGLSIGADPGVVRGQLTLRSA